MRNINSEKINFLTAAKELGCFCLSMSAILLSMCFPVVELQLLGIAIIAGIKWSMQGRNERTIIIMRGGVENVGSSEIIQVKR